MSNFVILRCRRTIWNGVWGKGGRSAFLGGTDIGLPKEVTAKGRKTAGLSGEPGMLCFSLPRCK